MEGVKERAWVNKIQLEMKLQKKKVDQNVQSFERLILRIFYSFWREIGSQRKVVVRK